MKIILTLAALAYALAAVSAMPAGSGKGNAAACAASGALEFVCGPVNAEDFVAVPGRSELILSGYAMPGTAAGKLYVLNTAAFRYVEISPIVGSALPEYASCPGPLELSRFKPHGVALKRGLGRAHLLYVVNHGTRESIEMFRVDTTREPTTLTWIGCVPLPQGTSGNGVAPLPDGGFVATKFYDLERENWMAQLENTEQTGAVYVWHPGTGFSELNGGRASGDNGIETSEDGKWVFVNIWPEKRVLRLSMDGSVPPANIPLDFMPDNIHIAPDGSYLIGGHITDIHILAHGKRANFPVDWAIARLDSRTLKVTYLLWEKGTPAFQGITGAVELDGKLWLSTFSGDRVGSLPLPTPELH